MTKQRNGGYSLVEVLIAIAITATVLLTVITLFYMGRRNVYSGKQMTYSVSVATRVLEDISVLTSSDFLTAFNITDSTTLGSVTLQGVTYADSATRDTTSCTANGTPPPAFTCTNDPSAYLSAWRSMIDEKKLARAQVGLIITPTSPADATKPWTTARFLKVRAYTQWDEGQARRRISFVDTTLVNRQ